MKKIKVVAIIGPTSAGKSDLSVEIAKIFNGEIISADSRQVYKGLNIGTGKITKKEMRGVPHHLLDITSPSGKIFNATKFKKLAERKILEIDARGRLPILVGGTGFWIDAVMFNKDFPEVAPDLKLRKRLEDLSAEKLLAMLQKLDPERAKSIDWKNKRRVIRAIEIARGAKNSRKEEIGNRERQFEITPLFIGLDLPTEKLYENIDKRLAGWIKKGILKEIQNLHKKDVSWKRLEEFGLEYKYLSLHLRGKLKKEEALLRSSYDLKHYAKRQRTWFKRNKEINWFDPKDKTKIIKLIKKFI
jgi:tRNA dimethylallyltransferase